MKDAEAVDTQQEPAARPPVLKTAEAVDPQKEAADHQERNGKRKTPGWGQPLMAYCKGESNAAKRDPVRTFWRMAAGKMKASPPRHHTEDLREALDKPLSQEGVDPRRREGDRDAEVNFRRLRAALELAGDPDYDFLEEMAAPSIPFGVDT